MDRTATFVIDERLHKMVEHASSAPNLRIYAGDLLNPDYLKDGVQDRGFNNQEADIDQTKLPRCLWLVNEGGLYLMSPGIPPLPDPDQIRESLALRALETDPEIVGDEGYDIALAITGSGNDFCEKIELDIFREIIATGSDKFYIRFSDDAFELLSPS